MKPETKKLLEAAVEQLKTLSGLKAIILYGSYARGEESKNSDIDLLLYLKTENPKKYLKIVIERISAIDSETKISPRLTNLKDHDASFFQNVLRDGIVLYGALVISPDNLHLEPYLWIKYDLRNLKGKEKVKVSRRVYGYNSEKSIKGKKHSYHYAGLKEEKGVFVAQGSVLIPESEKGFLDFLKQHHVSYTVKKAWLE